MDKKVPKLNEVDKEAGFSHHATGLTEEDETMLARIKVDATGEYNNFGDIDKIREDATEFFVQLGNSLADAKKQADIACRLVEKAIKGFGSEAAWVTIRAFTRTDEYKVPRWHADSKFRDTDEDQLKAVYTLLGSSTRLKRASAQQREEVRALQRAGDMDEMESRRRRTELLASSKTETTPAGCFTVMIAGDNDYATVHSEPDIKGPRIFLSVLPGTRKQIEELRLRMVDKKAGIKLEKQNPAQTGRSPRAANLKR